MEPTFYLQIVDRNGVVLRRFPAGGYPPGKDTVEAEIIEAAIEAIRQHPVGFWRTEQAVCNAIRKGLAEAFMALKRETLPLATKR